MIGGSTTGQGIKTQIRGGFKLYDGIMRNVEQSADPQLPEATTHVPDLKLRKGGDEQEYESFRKTLARQVCFYHLAEGIDAASRVHFEDLRKRDLITPNLVGVHALGLTGDDLKLLAAQGRQGRVVAVQQPAAVRPHARPQGARRLKVAFSIGCDWAPTGSKNLLQELKVARHAVENQNADLTSEDLVRAVTATAASLMGWEQQLGRHHRRRAGRPAGHRRARRRPWDRRWRRRRPTSTSSWSPASALRLEDADAAPGRGRRARHDRRRRQGVQPRRAGLAGERPLLRRGVQAPRPKA